MVEITAAVKPEVALKVYSNYLKGNPPFKPWKGMQGCAWFAFDGNPNAGKLEGRTVIVKATADIPGSTAVMTGAELERRHTEIMGKKHTYAAAEGKLWDEVGSKAWGKAGGMLIVEVGNTKFSKNRPGKYLLVNNLALHKVRLTQTQATALARQIGTVKATQVQAKITQNTATHGATFVVHYPEGRSKVETDLVKFQESLKQNESVAWDSIARHPQNAISRNSKKRIEVFWTLTYKTYHEAKREARRIYGQDRSILIEWGNEGGQRWMYKDCRDSPAPAPQYGAYRYSPTG
jgi:hypothetical protein